MVYKYKNNKWSRMIAARKLAALNRQAAADEQRREAVAAAAGAALSSGGEGDACEEGAAAQTNRVREGPLDASEKVACTALTENTALAAAKSACLRCCASEVPTRDELSSMPCGGAQPPRVVDACYVPSRCLQAPMGNASAVSGPPKYVTYILQTEDPGTEEVLTAFGVCNAQPDDSCLQVVYWNSRAHTTAARSPASAAGISVLPPAPSSALREVVMYVDAEGRCFMLAPSSVVSVGGAEVTSETGFTTSSSNQGGKDGDGLRDGAGAAALNADGGPYAYWLIPSVLKDLFLALLWARSHWRAAGRASTHSALLHGPLPSFKVQLHDSRWASTATAAEAPGAHARDYVGSAANAPVPPQQLTPSSLSKARKKKGMPRKRIRAATPPSDHALVNAEVSASQAGVSVTCRIPYVVKVTTPSASVRDVSTASNANSSQTARSCELRLPPSAVFHIGNRLTPFPPDHVL